MPSKEGIHRRLTMCGLYNSSPKQNKLEDVVDTMERKSADDFIIDYQ